MRWLARKSSIQQTCLTDDFVWKVRRVRFTARYRSLSRLTRRTQYESLVFKFRSFLIHKKHFAKKEPWEKVQLPFPNRVTSSWNPRREPVPTNLHSQSFDELYVCVAFCFFSRPQKSATNKKSLFPDTVPGLHHKKPTEVRLDKKDEIWDWRDMRLKEWLLHGCTQHPSLAQSASSYSVTCSPITMHSLQDAIDCSALGMGVQCNHYQK